MSRLVLLGALLLAGVGGPAVSAAGEAAATRAATHSGTSPIAHAPAEKKPAAAQPEATPPKPKIDLNSPNPPPSTYDLSLAKGGGHSTAGPEERSLLEELARTVIGLLIVVGLIYLFARFGLQRLMGLRGGNPLGLGKGKSRSLKVVERVQLDAKHALFLVEIDTLHRVLLGTGEQGVQLLSELGKPGSQRLSFRDAMTQSGPPTPGSQDAEANEDVDVDG